MRRRAEAAASEFESVAPRGRHVSTASASLDVARGLSLVIFVTLVANPIAALSRPGDPGPTNPDPPYLASTIPAEGAVGVRRDALLDIRFSTAMDTSNTFVFIRPSIPLTRIWIDTTRVWVTHPNFAPCTTYRLWADGYDIFGEAMAIGPGAPGAANPWSFTTECEAFTLTLTDPEDNETDVPPAGMAMGQLVSPITIWFSRAADPATFRLSLTPSIPLTPVWTKGNGSVTLRHDDVWFEDCALHTVTVSAKDTSGNPLTNISGSKPNPWTFTTVCLGTWIVSTSPANGTTGVGWGAAIVVSFSKRMNRATVSASLVPDPGFPFESNWMSADRVLTLTHDAPFPPSVTFTVNVAGKDKNGNGLVPGPVPNPWTFSTASTPSPPAGLRVSRTPPDILLTWTEVAGATSYAVYSSTDRFLAWPWPKLADATAPMYLHRGAHDDGLSHYYIVRAKQASITGEIWSENSTMGVKATLSFEFDVGRTNVYWISLPERTMYRRASDIATELTADRIDVIGMWDAAAGRTTFWYFFRGGWRGTDFVLAAGEGLFIGTVASFEWVVNGTDAGVSRSFALYAPPNTNEHFTALPYTATYARASDLVADVEGDLTSGARITEISRWDPTSQRFETFSWSPAGWTGVDFMIRVGEAVRFVVVDSFVWTPRLLTPEVP